MPGDDDPAEAADEGGHDVPVDLVELHEVLAWERATGVRPAEDDE